MARVAGAYQLVKNENFVQYLVASGIPEDKANAIDGLKPRLEVAVDGKKITLNSDSGIDNASSTLILDEEVDEPIPGGTTLKTCADDDNCAPFRRKTLAFYYSHMVTLNGDILTVTSKSDGGKVAKREYKFSTKELVVTFSDGDGKLPVAKRFYTRLP